MAFNLQSENYGENLSRYISDYQKDLKKDIKLLERLLEKSPDGDLRIQKSGKRYKWFRYQLDTKDNYIKKKDKALAAELAAKQYYRQMLAAKQEELALVSDFGNDIKHLSETERQFLSAEDEVGKLAAIELLNVNIKGKTFKENIEDWLNEPFQSNPNHLENLKISAANGLLVRSKSEAFIASELYAAGIPFRYECLLILNNGNALYPDFTILNPYTKEIVIWEHFGMMEDEEYSKLAMFKTKDYISNGFIPDRNLILTYETKNAPLDFGLVKKKVKYLFA